MRGLGQKNEGTLAEDLCPAPMMTPHGCEYGVHALDRHQPFLGTHVYMQLGQDYIQLSRRGRLDTQARVLDLSNSLL